MIVYVRLRFDIDEILNELLRICVILSVLVCWVVVMLIFFVMFDGDDEVN